MSLRALQWCVIRLFINELTNEWIDQRVVVQTRPMIRMIAWQLITTWIGVIHWMKSKTSPSDERWWLVVTLMIIIIRWAQRLIHYLGLHLQSYSSTWWLKSLGWSLNQMMTIVFSEVLDSGGRLTAQWGWVNENCFLFMTPCLGVSMNGFELPQNRNDLLRFTQAKGMTTMIRFPCLLAMHWWS